MAMPASTTPMMPVNVSSETPTYGRQQAPGEDLQHEHRAGGDEHDRTGEAAVHRRDGTGRALFCPSRIGPDGPISKDRDVMDDTAARPPVRQPPVRQDV